MQTFTWTRKVVTPQSYKNDMEISDCGEQSDEFTVTIKSGGNASAEKQIVIPRKLLDAIHGSKELSAYNAAADIRKFEIDLSWRRAAFFWAFIAAIYTAYYHILAKIYCFGSKCNPRYEHGHLPLVILAALGLFFCFSWLLSCKGSKHWYENWEKHIDLLEDNVTGPLYKTYEAGKAYSESKITIAAGWVVTACAYGLLVYEFAELIVRKIGKGVFQYALSLVLALIIPLVLFGYSRLVLGNIKNSGNFKFTTKKYEGML